MRIQIDTAAKTLTIEEAVNLGEFIEIMDRMFPLQEWRKYTLQVSIINNWSTPVIYVREWREPYFPWFQPYYGPGITTFDSTGTIAKLETERVSLGTLFNIEV